MVCQSELYLGGDGHLRLGSFGSLLPLPLLLVSLLRVAVEEQVGHHLPLAARNH